MRYVALKKVQKGMVLARPLIGDEGILLVKEHCAITDNIYKRISDIGYQGVYIEDEMFNDVSVEDVITDDIRVSAYEALSKGEYADCTDIAAQIVAQMRVPARLKLDLLDIKTEKNYEFRHCISVAVISVAIGIKMGLNEEQLNNLAVAGLLHDIGKFDVKKKVLRTNKVYTEKQMDEMKKHPIYSYEILKDIPTISSVSRNSILFHHENLDGTGYYSVAGEKLGLFPRILRVADTYDALTANRKHRDAFSPAYAFKDIAKDAGRIYDKAVVQAFISMYPMYPKGFEITLSNGETGVVIDNSEHSERPIIRLYSSGTEIDLYSNKGYRTIEIED